MKTGFTIKYLLLVFVIILSGLKPIEAQNQSNPFDLQHRLSEEEISKDNNRDSTANPFDIPERITSEVPTNVTTEQAQNPVSENPFDIKRVDSNNDNTSKTESKPILELPKKRIEKPTDTKSGFLFWTILITMVLLALLVTLYRSLILKIYRAFANENILKLLQREQSAVISAPFLFLYTLFFISGGIFLFQLAYYYEMVNFELSILLYCMMGLTAFFILKHLILMLVGFVFPVSKEVKQYSFTIVTFSIILGFILIPFNIFIAFAHESLTNFGILTALGTISIFYLYRSLRGVFIGSKFLAFHKFHFFMYICTVEIAPTVVLIKLLLNGVHIQ